MNDINCSTDNALQRVLASIVRQYKKKADVRELGQSIISICGVPDIDRTKIENKLGSVSGVVVCPINSRFIKGLYAEQRDFSFLLFSPIRPSAGLSQDYFNQSIDAELNSEIKRIGEIFEIEKLKQINASDFVGICHAYKCSLAMLDGITLKQLESIKFKNSYNRLVEGIYNIDLFLPVLSGTHLYHLSYNYYWILTAISNYMVEGATSIHDVGTNTGYLPLLLNDSRICEKFNFNFKKIIGSDIAYRYSSFGVDVFKKENQKSHKRVSIVYGDLIAGLPGIPNTDVVTAIDILEHFEEDISYKIFAMLWGKTLDLLLVHVPFETQPEKMYGHCCSFTPKKISDWAEELKGAYDVTPANLKIHGYLFLKKLGA